MIGGGNRNMKLITAAMAIMVLIYAAAVSADEINASVEVKGENTVISCVPAEGGSIAKAYISIFGAAGGSGERQEMEVSVDNRAFYVLPGVHEKIDGRCKLFMADNSGVSGIPSTERNGRTTLQGEFSLAAR